MGSYQRVNILKRKIDLIFRIFPLAKNVIGPGGRVGIKIVGARFLSKKALTLWRGNIRA